MKKLPNKIILNLLLILLLSGCHTLQHNGFQSKIPKKEECLQHINAKLNIKEN